MINPSRRALWRAVLRDLRPALQSGPEQVSWWNFLYENVENTFDFKEVSAWYRSVNQFIVTGDGELLDRVPQFRDSVEWSELRSIVGDGVTTSRAVNFLRAIRQALGLFSRLTVSLEAIDDRADFQSALEDQFIERVCANPETDMAGLRSVFTALLWDLRLDALASYDEFPLPQDGPGAVAEHFAVDEKGAVILLDDGLRELVSPGYFRYPFSEPSTTTVASGSDHSEVYFVPKDFRGPRVIAAEPLLRQNIKGGAERLIRRYIGRHPILREVIHLTDQGCSQRCLRSHGCSIATIDLSDASDTVRIAHARLMPSHVCDWLMALRTPRAQLPSGRCVTTTTLFTMGDKLCFPVESVVFASVALIGGWLAEGRDLRRVTFGGLLDLVRRNRGKVLVYGDDIIVPSEWFVPTMETLRRCGFKPNDAKCCHNTLFREACGMDCWNGEDISILRPRRLVTSSEQRLDSDIANVQLLADRGMVDATLAYLWQIKERYRVTVPVVAPGSTDSPYALKCGWLHDCAEALGLRRLDNYIRPNRALQGFQLKCWAPKLRWTKMGRLGDLTVYRQCLAKDTDSPQDSAECPPLPRCGRATIYSKKEDKRRFAKVEVQGTRTSARWFDLTRHSVPYGLTSD